jgi:hypothetical protein
MSSRLLTIYLSYINTSRVYRVLNLLFLGLLSGLDLDSLLNGGPLQESVVPCAPVGIKLLALLGSRCFGVVQQNGIQRTIPRNECQVSESNFASHQVLLALKRAINSGDGSLNQCLEVLG